MLEHPTIDAVWIGLDLGTQSCRALAVDDGGVTIAHAARPLHGHRDHNRHEQDPRAWWTAAADALAIVTAKIGTRPVGGVAVCATSGTVLLTGLDGTPRTPGLMYDDARAGALAGEAQDAGADLWLKLGYRIQPAWALPKLLWWRDQGLLTGDVRLAHQPDVVAAALTGHAVESDSSHALKTGYDQLDRCWPQAVLERLRLDPAVLPPVVPPGTTLGVVCHDAAERTGLPVGTPVVAGMTDGCAAQLGAGALVPGEWNSVLGTTLALKGVSTTLLHDPTGAVYSHRAPYGDLWLPGGASSSGAGAVKSLFPGADLAILTTAAAEVAEVPLCYPLTGRGERFPFVAPQAQGFLGNGALDRPGTGTGAARAFAAVCTGVAHVERLCFDVLRGAGADVAGPISFTGGGSRNPWWNQLRCDVLGVPVRLPDDPEPARGMAVLAAGAAGGDIPAAARRLVRVRDTLEPDLARGAALAPGYDAFVTALADRAWLDPDVANQARQRNLIRFADR
ncbi:FGGY-family carbohydrate kinase [Amycolatopsis sp. CA-126428]|uniref:FGGY-family carbohydrate kinase n=1 Tax=Amycolatopsis sp. CA-126428 TaxID=2073158 RepID=UPI000CD0E660|nr:FGGY family carbohydrate kinase [Amycolatopsis sp. CA-126428]